MHPPYAWRPAAPTRPPAVTAVVVLEGLAVVFCLVESVVGLYILVKTMQDTGDATGLAAMTGVDVAINVLLSVGLAVAAALLVRSSPAGRVLSWVTCVGYAVARCGCGGFSGIIAYLYGSGQIERSDFNFGANVWYVLGALEVVAIVLAVVIVVLLLTRPVRAHFAAVRRA
ncbi:MAG TPA: hypothetical protein VGN37_28685 [Actinocatenispora sp.]